MIPLLGVSLAQETQIQGTAIYSQVITGLLMPPLSVRYSSSP